MATADEEFPVEVAFAMPGRQVLIPLTVPAGTTAIEAIRRSGVLERFPGIDTSSIGVFGRLCARERVLAAGERVEIYRPLQADPKEVRRKLAAKGQTMDRKGERG